MTTSGRPLRRRRRAVTVSVVAALSSGVVACSSETTPTTPYALAACSPADLGNRSVARVWNETLLEMIREVVPAPTEHARNLFHTSVAMWDAWAAYDPSADGYLFTEKHAADDVVSARETAISFAAYRVLMWRYSVVGDLTTASDRLGGVMQSLCLRTDYNGADGSSPADVGNRIAAAVIDYGSTDGALEDERYVDSSYRPANDPLVVDKPGTTMRNPNAWQPLELGKQLAQNGLPIAGKVQTVIGAHWGHVAGFALARSEQGTPLDPGAPPRLGDPVTDQEYKDQALEVLRFSSRLDPADGVRIDISPSALGDNTLGTNDGDGHDVNPFTQQPYETLEVLRADFARALAEYWADGPKSETPPGHWNLIANAASDAAGFQRRVGGTGDELDPLEWDVKTYFVLNGALHDAAVAAWGLKGFYDSARPISMIRYMAGRGQSTDPSRPSYDPEGLPLEQGLAEVITAESSAPGARHEALADHIGEVAVRSWQGFPADTDTDTSGVGWILAVDWVPYQRATFVTPAFPGFVSGHSTFSRAGAEVLTAITGSEYFPGGINEWRVPAGSLLHEEGPTEDITLQWATYFDAADLAGLSRLYMGIHISADDFEGRLIGATCGRQAWDLAGRYFDGSARS